MKLRKLKKLLNNTEYIVNRDLEYPGNDDGFTARKPRICIGSPMCHDLISWNVETKQLKTAGFCNGKFDKGSELEWLLNKMKELAESGALEEIASGNDELQNPIPVFTFRDNKIIKTFTEKEEFGWPHIDNEGYLMYDNTFFRTEMECMRYAVKTLMIDVRFLLDNLSSEFDRMGKRIKYCAETSKALEDIYAGMRKNENASADRKPDGM